MEMHNRAGLKGERESEREAVGRVKATVRDESRERERESNLCPQVINLNRLACLHSEWIMPQVIH